MTGSLRDILLGELEDALEEWGTPYAFPPSDQLTNHKDALIEAVATLQQKYPDYGLLLVVDELLDYLRGREEQPLILDLGFLRELGEVAALTPFRFLAGLQETLFDSPRFSFVAEQLRRVRDRFEQVLIAREDIAFVVSERLLNKTDEQMARIREHLRPFTPLYHEMAERLDEYVRLFPIHPAYIDTFERVYVAEKREVLKTFSRAVQSLLDQEVPSDQPGMISYDHYWQVLRDNPSMRGLEGVGEVIDKSQILEGRVKNAYTKKHLLPIALRIIHALSVNRLTTPDIRTPLGPTPEELRDHLTLYTDLPETSAEMLLDQVEVALKAIVRTVSGQYISYNDANGQYYLDVDKDIDFDAKIHGRGDFMTDNDLNRYFYDALRLLLGLSDTTYVSGWKIWSYELPWADHKVTRPGYLFFGAPDERSTAQPPQDFYIYILPPFTDRKFTDGKLADEVIFKLTGLGQDFKDIVENYAGARALANESSSHREIYADKADNILRRRLNPWLRDNFTAQLQVIHQGVEQPVQTVLTKTRSTASQGLEDILRIISSYYLDSAFSEKYSDYPVFERAIEPISEDARPVSAMEAVRSLAGRGRTNLAQAVLEGLKLVDAEGIIRPNDSPFAKYYLGLLQKKPEGQVANQGEIIEQIAEGIQPIYKGIAFKLEPEWVVVVLLALVYSGEIVLNLDGRQSLDAGSIENAATMGIETLTNFRFFGRPRELPINLWVMIFEGLELRTGLMRDENTRELAVKEHLQPKIQAELEKTATLLNKLQSGLQLWNMPIFTDRYDYEVEGGVVVSADIPDIRLSVTELLPDFREYKGFLETLSRFNTTGKLRNLRLTPTEIDEALAGREVVLRGERLLTLVNELQPLTSYLAEAQANLSEDDPWFKRAKQIQSELLGDIRKMANGEASRKENAIRRELQALKEEYVKIYADLHRKLALGPKDDDFRQSLYNDPRLETLRTLSQVDLLQDTAVELSIWEKTITGIRICREFHEGLLDEIPTCSCGLRPSQQNIETASAELLLRLDERLGSILLGWQQALRNALESEAAERSIEAMNPKERKPLKDFLSQPDDEPNIPPGFVVSVNRALRGIEALTLSVDDLIAALKIGGLPCTLEELMNRFNGYINQAMRGHDERNTRLTLDQ
ncbi:MAG: ATP-binding protein [Chloroflexi bacterium]|nr:ATP-binding protein [Chloroflexota bacterium]